MTFHIQPKELEIPEKEPFKLDLLDREETVKILTQLMGSISGPCVLALDAPWGAGKTTFIRLWHQYLINNGFTVIRFNAWENDFYDDPFVALCAELSAGQNTGFDKKELIAAGEKVIKHVAWNVSGQVVATLSAGTVNLSELAKAYETAIKERLKQYQNAKNEIKEFRDTLQAMAVSSTEKRNGPLIVMIDELDRCRPSYAVELLEVAKHLFAVDHIIFVLAINRSQLSQAVKGLYGLNFDAEGYLCRFFDVDVHLPDRERDKFIDRLLDSQPVDYSKFSKKEGRLIKDGSLRDMLYKFFGTSDLSLRDVEQAVHRLCLVLGSLPDNKPSFTDMTVVLLILRTHKAALYRRFVRGEVSDLEVVEELFAGGELKALRQTHEARLIEAFLIIADKEIARASDHPPDMANYDTLLEKRYKSKSTAGQDKEHIERVFSLVRELQTRIPMYSANRYQFTHAVRRLELFSGLLGDELP